jgi:membrane protein
MCRMTEPRDDPPLEEAHGVSRITAQMAAWRTEGRRLWQLLRRWRPFRTFFHFTDVGGNVLAAGMSYQALFAVFAALWVGFGVLGVWLRGRTELLDSLIEQINLFVPGLLGDDGLVAVSTLLDARSLDWSSVVAGIALLWVTVTWFTGTRRSIRIIFTIDVREYRSAILLKLRDFVLALLFFVALLISAALTVFSTNLTDWLLDLFGIDSAAWLLGGFGVAARYALLYVFDVCVLLGIHYFLAEVRVPRWRLLSGCALGGGALLGLKVLGTVLLGGVSSNPLLASFAVLIGLLVWFNLICRTLLLTASWIATGVDRELGVLA